ncbi:MAG: rhomboid family intramembrane serine protease [Chitinophagales bacterium]|nr:rhomboid family intramembrane serine protease [Chitinophagales bacterium]
MLTNSITQEIQHKFRHGNMVMKLIFVNIGVFLFFGVFSVLSYLLQNFDAYNWLLHKLEVPASVDVLLRQPWSLFTYMFLHSGILHILFNLLWLYWFGEIFVLFLGDKKILPLYLLGGVVGALLYVLAFNLLPVFAPKVATSQMLGASAAVFAIVFAAATLSPDYEVRLLLFGVVRIKYIALIALVLDIISIPYGNAGGYIAHLGGALTGVLYIKALRGGTDFGKPLNRFFDFVATVFKPKPKVKVTYKSSDERSAPKAPRSKSDQEKIDEILDKISRSGYDSLTKEEKDFLFHYSNK